jgi:hypothetical protein
MAGDVAAAASTRSNVTNSTIVSKRTSRWRARHWQGMRPTAPEELRGQ